MRGLYRVDQRVTYTIPIFVEADSPIDAIGRSVSGEGEAGQRWYEEDQPTPSVQLIESLENER